MAAYTFHGLLGMLKLELGCTTPTPDARRCTANLSRSSQATQATNAKKYATNAADVTS